MENKIRVASGVKKIEVNDDGEFISLPVADDNFVVRFYRLMDGIGERAKEIGSEIPEYITGKIEAVEKVVAVEKETKREVDELFGDGTCRKVFGDILPSMDLFVEFFGSLLPFFEEYKQDRMRRMGKYGAERTGSSL